MSTLHFPSRFALLARSWRFHHTSDEIARTMNLRKDQLSKFVSGEAVKIKEDAGRRHAATLGTYLDQVGVLQEHGLTRQQFIELFLDPDDLRFIQFVVAEHRWPVPRCVQSAPRQMVLSLASQLTGMSLLYRLGIDERRSSPSSRSINITRVPVLRRIPVLIRDCGDNFLTYEDSYGWYGESYEPASAAGFVFYTNRHICIFAEDVDATRRSDLFMIQLSREPIDRSDSENHLFEGLILMNGDLGAPTASKVIMRRAPDQTMPWEKFSREAQLKIDLRDDDGDQVFDLVNKGEDIETLSGQRIGSKLYSWYARRLQIKNYKLDISLGDDY